MIKNKFDLGFYPTPLQHLKKLASKYPTYTIFIKRDDNSGLASGGNKTRKLEYLIQHALDNGQDTIITSGAQQSNHCRQTAAACAVAGLECHLLLGGTEPEEYNGNLLLSSLLGAKIHFMGENRRGEDSDWLHQKLTGQGKKCYTIPGGGSNIIGALGFVYAVNELKTQLKEQNLKMDYIFFASSSGATQAGLLLGRELFELETELYPINIDKEITNGQSLDEVVLNLVNEGKKLLGIDKEFTLNHTKIYKEYDTAGYAVLTENEKLAVNELAKTEGIILDPVYTGRAFYGMMDGLENKKIPQGSNVLFWHTGGLPALFDYPEIC